jgi:hypothetical protein
VAQQLGDEERIAVGLPGDLVGQPEPGVVELVSRRRLHDLDHLRLRQTSQRYPLDSVLAAQVCKQLGEWMPASDVRLPVGADEEQPNRGRGPHDVAHQLQRRLVRPVQVVEDEHDRRLRRGGLEQAGDRPEEQVALGLRITLARSRQLGHACLEPWHQPSQLAAVAADVRAQHRVGTVLHVVTQRLQPRLVGSAQVLLASSIEDRGVLITTGAEREVRCQARLADAGLTREEDDPSPPGARLAPQGFEPLALGCAADVARVRDLPQPRWHGQPGALGGQRLPADLEGGEAVR